MGILGCPLEGIPPYVEPLYERYWAWQMGVKPHGPFIASRCVP